MSDNIWLACHQSTDIADVCGCDEKTVRDEIGEMATLPKLRNGDGASADHATDFDLWLSCHAQQEIAEVVGCDRLEVQRFVQNGNLAELNKTNQAGADPPR